MMQSDEGSHVQLCEAPDHLYVAVERILIPSIRRWLDPAPFKKHAVSILRAFCCTMKIFPPATIPPIACLARSIAMNNPPRFLFPGEPITVHIITFNLIGCGCSSPKEAARKMKCCLCHEFSLIQRDSV